MTLPHISDVTINISYSVLSIISLIKIIYLKIVEYYYFTIILYYYIFNK